MNEYSQITEVAIRSPLQSFIDEEKLSSEWESLRFHAKPHLKEAIVEFNYFRGLLADDGITIIDLPSSSLLTIDGIYTRDSILISKAGLILCNMGRSSRTPEAVENYAALSDKGYKIAGQIKAPGTLEGGDFIWIDNHHAAVGLGPRTNAEGINQLKQILGSEVNLHVVDFPLVPVTTMLLNFLLVKYRRSISVIIFFLNFFKFFLLIRLIPGLKIT